MNHFYRAMLREGLPPAAALRKVKQAMQASSQWRHPYYWAAFVLQGDYRERINLSKAGNPNGSALIEILMILSLAGL